MAAPKTVDVLVLPLLRRAWLQHVCSGASARGPPPAAWQSGETLGAKARLAVAALQHKVGGAHPYVIINRVTL